MDQMITKNIDKKNSKIIKQNHKLANQAQPNTIQHTNSLTLKKIPKIHSNQLKN